MGTGACAQQPLSQHGGYLTQAQAIYVIVQFNKRIPSIKLLVLSRTQDDSLFKSTVKSLDAIVYFLEPNKVLLIYQV